MDREARIAAAARALEGLSVGDAFGQAFFVHDVDAGTLPPSPWSWTDDTAVAHAVYDELVGDRDTTCAIVGGGLVVARSGVPSTWLSSREPLRG